ncbi:MAG: hypothetical protein FJZ56_03195 [Chlamydiae bacterium]|nr:hypothetical protein [Chlamydiota bacterium]
MSSKESSTHGKLEIRLQSIATICMALGLVISIYYNSHILKSERIETELATHLHLTDRYHKLLFTLIQNDSAVFEQSEDAFLQSNKYLIYEFFELLATVNSLQPYFEETAKDVWPTWKKRMEFLFSKPAIRKAWYAQRHYADHIYKSEFISDVDKILSCHAESL